MRAVCWGVRGSMPTPGPDTARHGGNTSCVEIRTDAGRTIILDAGSGIAGLGRRLVADATARDADLFLTHFHWDHVQGLPFFEPLYDAAWTLRIHGEPQAGASVEELLAVQMRAPFFPVGLAQIRARVTYRHIEGEAWMGDGVVVRPFRARHPGLTCGFRVECDGAAVVYLPDDEPEGTGYDVAASWKRDVIAFLRGADLLLHDAMYTDAEYAERRGWGHGSVEQAVRLAAAAGVPRLLLFHHAPTRSDAALDAIVADARRAAREARVSVAAAVEGEEIELRPVSVPS